MSELSTYKITPVSILTGFLGAGKTTTLNYILREKHGLKIGLIINEFGEISIDNQLVEKGDEEILEMNNGCICCTVRSDLVKSIRKLYERKDKLDYIIIETTGLANPGPVAQTFFNIPELQKFVRLDSIITLIDAEHFLKQLEVTQTVEDQARMGDFLVINKTDLIPMSEVLNVERKLRELNPFAQILKTQNGVVPLKELLDVGVFDVNKKLELEPTLLDETHHHHDTEIVSMSYRTEKAFDLAKFESWVQTLSEKERVIRSKGIISVRGEKRKAVFHGVNNRFSMYWDKEWLPDEKPFSQVVLIGPRLDKQKLTRQIDGALA
ncbi:GTP-binding protein [Kamptonema cortianum]|nr:GTP-binding protein [Oscillatoria laete-virens]MDK3159641.1 GTP-binding protein [Kamptonema cortianum]MDL5050289.1 GTP-binding protein [Oscillatoria amoena NRMC-F 0135]MDL5055122.1 GTP-binding protein [Oscillatoria laete-virens NRMC-F 0139]